MESEEAACDAEKLKNKNFLCEKQKRRQYSLEMKLHILRELDSGKKQAHVAKQYNLSSSTLSMILKSKDKIMSVINQTNLHSSRKRIRLGNHKEVESALAVWLRDQQDRNIPTPGPLIQAKAVELANYLGVKGFEASNGWLFRFRLRNGFSMKCNGEELKRSEDLMKCFLEPEINVDIKNKAVKILSGAEAQGCVDKLRQYLEQQKDVPASVHISLDEIDDFISMQVC